MRQPSHTGSTSVGSSVTFDHVRPPSRLIAIPRRPSPRLLRMLSISEPSVSSTRWLSSIFGSVSPPQPPRLAVVVAQHRRGDRIIHRRADREVAGGDDQAPAFHLDPDARARDAAPPVGPADRRRDVARLLPGGALVPASRDPDAPGPRGARNQ